MNELIGKKFIDRYEVVSRLGSGGMAVVYKAVDTVLNRIVTVKILQEELANNEKFVHRFRKEAQAVAALSHPNIVKVYDVGYSEGHHYLIMEYIEGQTLKDVINKKGHLSVEQSLDYTYQILGGLYHAHSYGVIHRDIKPQNIMITVANQVKIMDFGLALNLTDSTITYDNSVMGSVYYIAPEIAQKGTGDARADLYSTGIVLYEMLTGKLPFTGESPIAIALQHVEGDYESVDDVDDSIPFEVARLVDKAMEANPADRYHSANLMMHDVETAASENDITLKSALLTKEYSEAAPITPLKSNRPDDPYRTRDFSEDDDYAARTPKKQPAKPNKHKNKGNKRTKKIIIIAVIAILVLAIGTYAGIRIFTGTEEVTVPNVEGEHVDDALALLEAEGLEGNVVPTASEDVEVDYVISQDIGAGQKVKKGRTINLAVSTGMDAVEVPNVVGEEQARARDTLENKQFRVEVKETSSDTVAAGKVVTQEPTAGQQAGKGSVVTIYVSTGPQQKLAMVPDLLGLTLEDAKNLLVSRNLKAGSVTEAFSSSVDRGHVSYQSVKAGEQIAEGSAVDLTVSKGPESKTKTINYTIPDSYGSSVRVVITVEDSNGKRTDYDEYQAGGTRISVSVTYTPPATATITIDGTPVSTQELN